MEVLFIGSSQPSVNTLLKKAQVNGELAILSKCPTHPAPEGRFELAGRGMLTGWKKKHCVDNSVS